MACGMWYVSCAMWQLLCCVMWRVLVICVIVSAIVSVMLRFGVCVGVVDCCC